jgi:hypothetical protein
VGAITGVKEPGHQPSDLGRGVELAPAFAGGDRELGDQPLVGLTEHVGRDAGRVESAELVEVLDDPGQVVSRECHLVVEVGALEDAGQLLRVGPADGGQGVVQGLALEGLIGVADVLPAVA